MNWKEQLDEAYGSFKFGEPISKPGYEAIKQFISTEIIEKLIEGIEHIEVKYRDDYANDMVFDVKAETIKQLRDKWI